jgi:hypothetical protein
VYVERARERERERQRERASMSLYDFILQYLDDKNLSILLLSVPNSPQHFSSVAEISEREREGGVGGERDYYCIFILSGSHAETKVYFTDKP